jgi:GDP-L-fucose synthase
MTEDFFGGKRVLVTGGAGFIGSHVVEMLVRRRAIVTVPVRATSRLDFLAAVQDQITVVRADLNDRAGTDAVVAGQQIVLNLAAAKGGGIANSIRHQASLFRDNMTAFLNVLDAARAAEVERFLVVSSACVYPQDTTSPTPENEGFKDAPEAANRGYGWSKRMEEYLGQAYAEEFGMPIAIARPYNAYGPRDDFFAEYNHVIPGLLKRILGGEDPLIVWGSGRQTRTFLYVTDFARGLLEVCEKYPVADPINIGSSEETTIADLARTLVELAGLKTRIVFDTSRPEGQLRRTCDTRKAEATVGFRAEVPLREGLDATIRWYRAELESRRLVGQTL